MEFLHCNLRSGFDTGRLEVKGSTRPPPSTAVTNITTVISIENFPLVMETLVGVTPPDFSRSKLQLDLMMSAGILQEELSLEIMLYFMVSLSLLTSSKFCLYYNMSYKG